MVGENLENSYLAFLKNASKIHEIAVLHKTVVSYSTMVGENFENSYTDFLNTSKIDEILLGKIFASKSSITYEKRAR